MKRLPILLMILILGTGCQSMMKRSVSAAAEGAKLWLLSGGKEKIMSLAKTVATDVALPLFEKAKKDAVAYADRKITAAEEIFAKEYGSMSLYENPDGSTDWTALLKAGLGATAAYIGLRQSRKGLRWVQDKRLDGLTKKVVAKANGSLPASIV